MAQTTASTRNEVQTPQQRAEQNRSYIKDILENVKIGSDFHAYVDKKMREGEKLITIPLELVNPPDTRKLAVSLEIKQLEPGKYGIDGYRATLKRDKKEDVSQFFTIYDKKAFTLDQAIELLDGGAVRNKAKVEGGEIVDQYTRIDFSQKTQYGNFRMRSYPAEEVNLVALLSQVNAQYRRDEKDQILKAVDRGEAVPIKLMSGEMATLRLAPQDRALQLINKDGTFTLIKENTARRVVMDEKTLKLLEKGGQTTSGGRLRA